VKHHLGSVYLLSMTERNDREGTRPVDRGTTTKRRSRVGWAAASQKIAEAGDDRLVWPEFANADDNDLSW